MNLISILCSIVGILLIFSVFKSFKKEANSRGEITKGILVVILDVLSEPITSEGLRIFFGFIFIIVGFLLL
ncbi:hypothetical protein [Neobacillus sp. LXY-1]|uniref:hypothetical protein n=1 Tax=Neobacillus sp. LXY-1 TaxID=3379133 RepID=UPI003EDFD2CE